MLAAGNEQWLYCSRCYKTPVMKVTDQIFYVTTCPHILCQECYLNYGPICGACKQETDISPVSAKALLSNPLSTALSAVEKIETFVRTRLTRAISREFLVPDDAEGSDELEEDEEAEEALESSGSRRGSLDSRENFRAADDLKPKPERDHITQDITDTDQQKSQEITGLEIDESRFELLPRLDLPERPTISREAPLSRGTWETHLDAEGRVTNVRELKLLIYRGGMCPSLRSEVWKFLLGFHSWDSTAKERDELRTISEKDYYRMQEQWQQFSQKQIQRFRDYSNRKNLIEKDVERTDRTHDFFHGDSNANVTKLQNILMTYCMYNFDLGYVQGMSDLLSPILVVMKDEVDAFWCFASYMEKVHENFEMTQKSILTQLRELRDLLTIVNPSLVEYLESHSSDNMYFSFRWLLVFFKREFSFEKTMRLWEVLWTELPCKNFHLLVCVAILDQHQKDVIRNNLEFTEILKFIMDLSMKIDLEETLVTAELIFHQLAAIQDKLPRHICDILGFQRFDSTDSPSHSISPSIIDTSSHSTENLSPEKNQPISPPDLSVVSW